MERVHADERKKLKDDAVFPVIVQIDKQCIFRKKGPMIFGVDILDGQLRIGTPLCTPEKGDISIGYVASIEKDRKLVEVARKGTRVCIKIEQNTAQQHILYGRHFDCSTQLVSLVTRKSIDTLKEVFEDHMRTEDWVLIKGLKKGFQDQLIDCESFSISCDNVSIQFRRDLPVWGRSMYRIRVSIDAAFE